VVFKTKFETVSLSVFSLLPCMFTYEAWSMCACMYVCIRRSMTPCLCSTSRRSAIEVSWRFSR